MAFARARVSLCIRRIDSGGVRADAGGRFLLITPRDREPKSVAQRAEVVQSCSRRPRTLANSDEFAVTSVAL